MENKPICTTDINGTKKWQLDGRFHREDGPAIEYKNGDTEWFINGIHHREDGPAIEFVDGTFFWIHRNKLHKLDGPAVKHSYGSSYWYIHGNDITEKITQWAKEHDIDLDNLTDVDKALIKLVWG